MEAGAELEAGARLAPEESLRDSTPWQTTAPSIRNQLDDVLALPDHLATRCGGSSRPGSSRSTHRAAWWCAGWAGRRSAATSRPSRSATG